VDVRRVLAYSCAAARDLHPLPIAPAMSRPTIMREPNFGKSETATSQIYREAELNVNLLLPLAVF
jgi:hypothetical protein